MKIVSWILIALFVLVVGDHAMDIIWRGPSALGRFCQSDDVCMMLVSKSQTLSDFNFILGLLAALLFLVRRKEAIFVASAYLLFHTATDLAPVYYNLKRFGTVWPEMPCIWEFIRLGWPLIMLAVFMVVYRHERMET